MQRPQGLGGRFAVWMMNRAHAPLSAWGFSQIALRAEWHALDVGCGGGANLRKLLENCRSAAGVDVSPVSVETSRRLNAEAIANGRCVIVEGDASGLPFQDNRFDLVTAFETVYFWTDLEKSFKEVYRVLKPGGQFFICNEAGDERKVNAFWKKVIKGLRIYTPEALTQILKDAGFGDIRVRRKEKSSWLGIIATRQEAGRI